jgi:hypothetical protein
MEIALRYSHAEIQRRTSSLQDQEILKLILLINRKKWGFIIDDFDNETATLTITTNTSLATDEVIKILDGTLPQVYKYGTIFIKISNECFEVNRGDNTGNRVILKPSTEKFDGIIKIVEFQSNGYFQNKGRLKRWLQDFTFIGNQFNTDDFTIEINHYGNIIEIQKSDYLKTVDFAIKEYYEGENYKLVFYTTPSRVQEKLIRHKKFGNISQSTYNLSAFFSGIPNHPRISLYVEYDHVETEWYYGKELVNVVSTEEALAKLKSELTSLVEKDQYKTFYNSVIANEIKLAAQQLNQRIHSLQESEHVYTKSGDIVFKKPTNENELVALYMKLEGLRLFPVGLDLKVVEYTPKKGIDSIGNFRLDATAHISVFQPIEFEYTLENYFAHEHPISQTKLIVCWHIDDENSINETCEIITTSHDWLIKLKLKDEILPVILISKFNTFNIKHSKIN